jgi:4-hydroxy-4-methyl-2-oxoglutarate aldolase
MRKRTILLCFFTGLPLAAQMTAFNREMLIKYTRLNPFPRFEDGRPKAPDDLMKQLEASSSEETWGELRGAGYPNQWEGGWQILHPEKKLIGRAVTAQFMPVRKDLNDIINADAQERGMAVSQNQRVIDLLQPGDVIVVDLFGKIENGTFAGDNLATAIYVAAGTGMVIDGAVRDREGIQPMGMPAYVRGFHPTAIGNVMLTGINVPIRVGNVTVMPGDVVFGDNEGVTFIPPHMLKQVVERAAITQLHDQWTKMKLKTGKYKSSDIYPRPHDPALIKEYEEWLAAEKARRGIR